MIPNKHKETEPKHNNKVMFSLRRTSSGTDLFFCFVFTLALSWLTTITLANLLIILSFPLMTGGLGPGPGSLFVVKS